MFPFLSQILVSVMISVAVWMIFSVSLLSVAGMFTGGGGFIDLTPHLPLSQSALYGLAVGVVHGLLTGLIVYFHKPDSVIGTGISSILVTEILIAIGFIVGLIANYFNRPVQVGKPTIALTYENAYALIVTVVFWYIVLSIIFLIPSIVIGLANKPFAAFSSK